MSSPDYTIPATSSSEDEKIIHHIYKQNHRTLSDDTDFALGIVTGDNKKHILKAMTATSEPIYRGKDISAYRYATPSCYIEFKPDEYQQVAAAKYYRSKKIVYRFICDRLVCMLDHNHSLILNSANAFISYKYPMETIVLLLNSCIYTFLFRKKFHSKKVLKSHLKELPLPDLTKKKHLHSLYRQIIDRQFDQASIDMFLCKVLTLSNKQYEYIKKSVEGKQL